MQSSSVVSVDYTSSFVVLVIRRQSVPATKWRATKCPRDKMAGDEVSPWRNGWRRSVPVTKCLVTKCTRDKMAGDEMAVTKADVPTSEGGLCRGRTRNSDSGHKYWVQTRFKCRKMQWGAALAPKKRCHHLSQGLFLALLTYTCHIGAEVNLLPSTSL